MATLIKRHARKPLAQGKAGIDWSNFSAGEKFTVWLGDYRLSFGRIEAETMSRELADMLTNPEYLKASGLSEQPNLSH